MRTLKHLPVNEWPEADREAFRAAYAPGDVFDDTAGCGAHLSEGTREWIKFVYRRWLGFLKATYPDDLSMPPADRITPERVRAFINHLSEKTRPNSVAMVANHLYTAARLIAPRADWAWLRSIKSRLAARAFPADRFDHLVPPVQTLNFGIELMDTAHKLPINDCKQREIQYRDGLLLALLSLWPIRRRSIAALTVSRHLEFDDAGVTILLHPTDTKAKRADSFEAPEELLPYLLRYLKEIRPVLLGCSEYDGFWALPGRPSLTAGRLYAIVRARIAASRGASCAWNAMRRVAGHSFGWCGRSSSLRWSRWQKQKADALDVSGDPAQSEHYRPVRKIGDGRCNADWARKMTARRSPTASILRSTEQGDGVGENGRKRDAS